MVVSTTMGSAGVERTCVKCKLSYRYARARLFTCQACGLSQLWDGYEPGLMPSQRSKLEMDAAFADHSEIQHLTPTGDPVSEAPAEIPLMGVLASLNHLSSDGVRALHDRLAILYYVDDANRFRSTERARFDAVRRALVGANVKTE